MHSSGGMTGVSGPSVASNICSKEISPTGRAREYPPSTPRVDFSDSLNSAVPVAKTAQAFLPSLQGDYMA